MRRVHELAPGAELTFVIDDPGCDPKDILGLAATFHVGCGITAAVTVTSAEATPSGVNFTAGVDSVTFDWWHHMVTDQPLVLRCDEAEDASQYAMLPMNENAGEGPAPLFLWRKYEWGETTST